MLIVQLVAEQVPAIVHNVAVPVRLPCFPIKGSYVFQMPGIHRVARHSD